MWTAEQGLWGILLPAEKKTCFGGGRLAIPCGGQRGKRPALVNPSSPGKSGIHADFRCRWPVVNESFSIGPSCSFYDRQGSA